MKSKRLYVNAYGPANLFNLSEQIELFIKETELINGIVFAFSVGSTGALVKTTSKEVFADWIMSYIPYNRQHRHPGNAFAHLRSTFLGSDMTLTVVDGQVKQIADLYLLENTSGKKQRPLELKAFGQFSGGGRINMKIASNKLPVKTNGWIDMVDLTQVANDIVLNSGINDGFLQIESLSAKTAISSTEYEGALLSDTADFIAEAVSSVNEEKRSDVAASFIGPSMMIPIKDGRLEVGVWQQPVLMDFGEAGDKEIFFQAVGM